MSLNVRVTLEDPDYVQQSKSVDFARRVVHPPNGDQNTYEEDRGYEAGEYLKTFSRANENWFTEDDGVATGVRTGCI